MLKFHNFIFLTCEEQVRLFFSDVKNWYQIFTNVKNQCQLLTTRVKNRYKKNHIFENWYQIITCEKMVSKLTRVKNWYQILTHVKNWYQIITDVKNWYIIVTDVSDKSVNNWNRVQNEADEGYFIIVRNTHVCYMKFDFVCI